jgi:uncharacterized Zn finger protein
MTAKYQPRFDIDALRNLAGEKSFARGQAYHRDGQVQLLAIESGRVLAQVTGTEDYRTVLVGAGAKIGGECSCPAFEEWGICKHMVAVALAANAAGNRAETNGPDALSRIRDHLKKRGVDALVEIIVDLAERDLGLFHKLDMAATVDHADDKTLEARMRKLIDKVTRTGNNLDYLEVPAWAADVGSSLDNIEALVSSGRAGLAFNLVERAIDRIGLAIEDIDDSDGDCTALLHRARDIHLAAARVITPEPVELARDLFAREMNGEYATFDDAAALYADVLGEQGLAEYRRLAFKAWQEPAQPSPEDSAETEEYHEHPGNLHRLISILDFFAERDGDVETRIALRARDLSSAWRYLQLAEFCLAQGRKDEAVRRAEEGLWVFEDGRPYEPLVLFAAELLSKAGRKQDAETQLWKAFEKAPSLVLYAQLCKLGAATGERAVMSLQARLAGEGRTHWSNLAELLVRILIEQKKFAEAWATVREHRVSIGTKEELARASGATHAREALQVYAEHVEQLAGSGNNLAYAEAAKLIARMATLRNAAEHASYLAALRERHGRKRNFMKLLG